MRGVSEGVAGSAECLGVAVRREVRRPGKIQQGCARDPPRATLLAPKFKLWPLGNLSAYDPYYTPTCTFARWREREDGTEARRESRCDVPAQLLQKVQRLPSTKDRRGLLPAARMHHPRPAHLPQTTRTTLVRCSQSDRSAKAGGCASHATVSPHLTCAEPNCRIGVLE